MLFYSCKSYIRRHFRIQPYWAYGMPWDALFNHAKDTLSRDAPPRCIAGEGCLVFWVPAARYLLTR